MLDIQTVSICRELRHSKGPTKQNSRTISSVNITPQTAQKVSNKSKAVCITICLIGLDPKDRMNLHMLDQNTCRPRSGLNNNGITIWYSPDFFFTAYGFCISNRFEFDRNFASLGRIQAVVAMNILGAERVIIYPFLGQTICISISLHSRVKDPCT